MATRQGNLHSSPLYTSNIPISLHSQVSAAVRNIVSPAGRPRSRPVHLHFLSLQAPQAPLWVGHVSNCDVAIAHICRISHTAAAPGLVLTAMRTVEVVDNLALQLSAFCGGRPHEKLHVIISFTHIRPSLATPAADWVVANTDFKHSDALKRQLRRCVLHQCYCFSKCSRSSP